MNVHKGVLARYVDSGALVKILGEEISIESSTHQDDLQVRPLQHQILENQQQEVTGKQEMMQMSQGAHYVGVFMCMCDIMSTVSLTSPLCVHELHLL